MLIRADMCGDKWRFEYNQNELTSILKRQILAETIGKTHAVSNEQKEPVSKI